MQFVKETFINASQERVFGFHELPDAFELLVPPFEPVKVLQKADISEIGSTAIIEQKLFGLIKMKWIARHTAYEPPYMFIDEQVEGPFAKWIHKHIVRKEGDGSVLRDEIEFDPGYSFIGGFGAQVFILPKIEKMFEYRHRITKEWCEIPSK